MSPRPGHGPESAGPLYPAAEVQTGASLGGVRPDTTAETLVVFGDNPERIHSEAAFAKLCSACQVPASSGMTRLVNDMVNRLIRFDTPRTTADQRRTPQSRADGAGPKGAGHTDLTTSFEDGDHDDVGDADRAYHQSPCRPGPTRAARLPPRQRGGGYDLRRGRSNAARHWTRAVQTTSCTGWKGTLTPYHHDK